MVRKLGFQEETMVRKDRGKSRSQEPIKPAVKKKAAETFDDAMRKKTKKEWEIAKCNTLQADSRPSGGDHEGRPATEKQERFKRLENPSLLRWIA
jgi:hypothetical protein